MTQPVKVAFGLIFEIGVNKNCLAWSGKNDQLTKASLQFYFVLHIEFYIINILYQQFRLVLVPHGVWLFDIQCKSDKQTLEDLIGVKATFQYFTQ